MKWSVAIIIILVIGVIVGSLDLKTRRKEMQDASIAVTPLSVVDNNNVGETNNYPLAEDDWGNAAAVESETKMFIFRINGYELKVTPENNYSAQALAEKLTAGPIAITMSDYGNFEKVGDLPWSLPTNDSQIITQTGDVILYQGDKITIYYDTNSWNFTRLGRIENVSNTELKKILGDGDVEATLQLE